MADRGDTQPVHDRKEMIRGMKPRLVPGRFVFLSVRGDVPTALAAAAVGMFQEDEGVSLIVPAELAPEGVTMRMISLTVHSALEGVGLTAAVSGALAREGIPANVVAAYYHDHVFVPEHQADQAFLVLQRLAAAGE